MSKKLYFIRHGLTEMNVAGLVAGTTDTPLVEAGRRQAHQASQQAKDLDIDCIVSSPLSRALDTAHIIAENIGYPVEKIVLSDLLLERDFGVLEGSVWTGHYRDMQGITGAEDDNILVERAQEALDFINSLPAKNILIVSHGGIGRAMRHILKGIPMNHPLQIPNAEILAWVEEEA